jgi:hypothetical protein
MRNIQNDQQAVIIALSHAQERGPIQKIRNVRFENLYDGILVDYADGSSLRIAECEYDKYQGGYLLGVTNMRITYPPNIDSKE